MIDCIRMIENINNNKPHTKETFKKEMADIIKEQENIFKDYWEEV